MGDLSRITVMGVAPESVRRHFVPHHGYERQKHWALSEDRLRVADERVRNQIGRPSAT